MRQSWRSVLLAVLCAASCLPTLADGPADNAADKVRPVPPPGIEIPEADRDDLEDGLKKLKGAIDELAQRKDARTQELLADVQIYHKAVHDALTYHEFFKPQEINTARSLLNDGLARAEQLKRGEAPWTTATGLVPRGYVSRIDGSVQPYGLIVPESFTPAGPHRWRLPALASCEVLVAAGEADRVIPFSHAERIAAELPDATLVRFPGAGHLPMLEQPAGMDEALLDLLQRCVAKRRGGLRRLRRRA